jgi:iron(III) transport system ATP-binding protein
MRDAIRDETVAILRETHATTVVVTHDPEEAMRIADRIVLMRAGAIVQEGRAEDIYRRPVDIAAARFFCDFNEVEGTARGGRAETPVGLFPAPGVPDGTAAVCIRPQGVRHKPAGFCLPGRLLSRRFLGEVELVQIAVQGLENPHAARVRGPVPASPGEDVGVEIDPDEVLVFAAGPP